MILPCLQTTRAVQVSEGVINLADAFFEMERGDAARGLELYKESTSANEALRWRTGCTMETADMQEWAYGCI